MSTAIIYDPRFLNHLTGDCPENPERYQAILTALQDDVHLWNSILKLQPRLANEEDILRCHDKNLIQNISQLCNQGGGYIDADTVVCPASFELACLSAGAALVGVDAIFTDKIKNAFSLARPPGHHATRDQAMGFCLFNNAAIAARYAQSQFGVNKILIIDWDVHHGNGTQDIFYSDPSVFYFSLHEYPFYPGTGSESETGEGPGKGTTLNIPLPARTRAHIYRHAFKAGLSAIEKIFSPDLIIISAGFDSRRGDPLADFLLSEQDYYEMTKEIMDMAERHCSGKVLSILEGGYLNETLGPTVRQHLAALANL